MTWDAFIYFASAAVLLWAVGALCAWKNRSTAAIATTGAGILVFATFIALMWVALERPPLRTMGETRLWYSLFLPLAGVLVYIRWKYKWILSFSALLATVFICINLLKPEIHSKTLMPALQSPWFAPHVIVYMFAYALLGAAALMAIYLLCKRRASTTEMGICDNLVYVGLAFMTIGMLFGALWAKEAWGHYWAWDPKEPGQPSPGSPTSPTSTSDASHASTTPGSSPHSSPHSCCCKCAGGASTTSPPPKPPASTPTTSNPSPPPLSLYRVPVCRNYGG